MKKTITKTLFGNTDFTSTFAKNLNP